MAIDPAGPSDAPVGQSANALPSFFLAKGRCFRILKSEHFGTVYCNQPVTWRGHGATLRAKSGWSKLRERHRPDVDKARGG